VVTVSKGGQSTLVYVNPHNGDVLGSVGSKEEFSWVVKRIHSLEYFGTWTNRIIEIVGGFALILVVTGIYLWWPRRQTGGVLTVRGTPSRRVFWRGFFSGAVADAVANGNLPEAKRAANALLQETGKAQGAFTQRAMKGTQLIGQQARLTGQVLLAGGEVGRVQRTQREQGTAADDNRQNDGERESKL